MLTIRLQRLGKNKFATYRLIISEKARDTQGRYLEQLGIFNPHAKENQLNVQADRVKYWIEKGATTSDTVHNLLVAHKIIDGKKKKAVYISKKRQIKLDANKPKAKEESPAPAPKVVEPAAEPAPEPEKTPAA